MPSDELEMADLGGIMNDVVKDAYSQGFKDGLERAAEVARSFQDGFMVAVSTSDGLVPMKFGEAIAAAIERLREEKTCDCLCHGTQHGCCEHEFTTLASW